MPQSKIDKLIDDLVAASKLGKIEWERTADAKKLLTATPGIPITITRSEELASLSLGGSVISDIDSGATYRLSILDDKGRELGFAVARTRPTHSYSSDSLEVKLRTLFDLARGATNKDEAMIDEAINTLDKLIKE